MPVPHAVHRPKGDRVEERERAPSPGARYTRRSRARAKAGLAVLNVVVEEVPLVLALIDLKLLNPDLADDRRALAAAAGRALKAVARNALQPDGRIFETIRLDLILAALEKRESSRGSKSSSRPQQSPAGLAQRIDADADAVLGRAAARISASSLSLDDISIVVADAIKPSEHRVGEHVGARGHAAEIEAGRCYPREGSRRQNSRQPDDGRKHCTTAEQELKRSGWMDIAESEHKHEEAHDCFRSGRGAAAGYGVSYNFVGSADAGRL